MYQQIFVMQYIVGMSSADDTCIILPTMVKQQKNVFLSASLAGVCSRILCKDGIKYVS